MRLRQPTLAEILKQSITQMGYLSYRADYHSNGLLAMMIILVG